MKTKTVDGEEYVLKSAFDALQFEFDQLLKSAQIRREHNREVIQITINRMVLENQSLKARIKQLETQK